MDAEIWSHADIRHGGRLLAALFAAIVCKETAVVVGLALGVLPVAFVLPPAPMDVEIPDVVRAGMGFGFSLLLMYFAYDGRGWARIGLGILNLLVAGQVGLTLFEKAPPLNDLLTRLALGNIGLSVLIGLLLLFSAPLRAFSWSQANRRHTIPVPLDDAPIRRMMRRERSLRESIVAVFLAIGNTVLVIIVLALGAAIYGFGPKLAALLGQ